MDKPIIGITQGDTNGVGYEVILKVFADEGMLDLCTPVIYGSPKAAIYHRNACSLQTNFNVINAAEDAKAGQVNLVNCFGDQELKIDFGKSTPEAGRAALISLAKASTDVRDGKVDAIVTAPINKHSIQSNEFQFPGHTEFLEQHFAEEGGHALMILMNEHVRVALVTTHLPVSQIASSITQEGIVEKLQTLHRSLQRDFALTAPRIAVLALNPHCGDGGLIGTEEQDIIGPAVAQAFELGVRCFGPFAADGFFGAGSYSHFDAVLAMYHDQGLAPFKTLAMDSGVNYTAGLTIVRTSPDHGTAYDIAGQDKASPASMRQAIYSAIDICRNRRRYDEATANPLRKQYHDKRDDSDKLRQMEQREQNEG